MLFSSNVQNIASRSHHRTPKQGRPAERSGTPRHAGAAALPVPKHPRQARAGKTIERRKNRQAPDTNPSRRVFHTVMHKPVHRVIHRKRRKTAPVLPACENLISFAPCRRTGKTDRTANGGKPRIHPANAIHETAQKNPRRRPDAGLDEQISIYAV